MEWCGLDLSGSGQGTVVGFYEHGNTFLGFIKHLKILEWLSHLPLLKDSAPYSFI
jgi:hypothetical protein